MRKCFLLFVAFVFGIFIASVSYAELPLSGDTQGCLECHREVTPGIVSNWQKSRHAHVSPSEALSKPKLQRRISAEKIPDNLKNTVVGCAECHTANADLHKDTFEHNGFKVHVVVTPKDCASCHPVEVAEYDKNLMSHAYKNLMGNPVYHNLLETTNGTQDFMNVKTPLTPPDDSTNAESCLYCHGTKVEVKGVKVRETSMGEMRFPVLSGWPNEGVGRVNPDGSLGSCSSCHPRHEFSIETARKPYTCSECHKGPDVPAYKVYMVSKHGNIYFSKGNHWNFSAVPWTVGKDFSAPTCAVCHMSLVVTKEGEIVAERTHQMNDRSPWRIFGLIYAHPHPKLADTTFIKNSAGLPLPTELTGEPVKGGYLIDAAEQVKRRENMKRICLACHASSWVDNQFTRFERTIETTNDMTLTATKILLYAWGKKLAKGLADGDSIFNEAIEKMWVEQWLFYANSTRFASAMAGADYGAFANGRWYLSKNIQLMYDWLNARLKKAATQGKIVPARRKPRK